MTQMRLPLVIPSEESASGGDESRNGNDHVSIHLERTTSDPSETRNTSGESRDPVTKQEDFSTRSSLRSLPLDKAQGKLKLKAGTHSLEINTAWIERHSCATAGASYGGTRSTSLHFARNDNAMIISQVESLSLATNKVVEEWRRLDINPREFL